MASSDSNEDRLLRNALGRTRGVSFGRGAGSHGREGAGACRSIARTARTSWRCWWSSRMRRRGRRKPPTWRGFNRNWSGAPRQLRRQRLPRAFGPGSAPGFRGRFLRADGRWSAVAAGLLLVVAGGMYLRQGNEASAAAGGRRAGVAFPRIRGRCSVGRCDGGASGASVGRRARRRQISGARDGG